MHTQSMPGERKPQKKVARVLHSVRVGRKDTAVRTTYGAPIDTSHERLAFAPLNRLGIRRRLVNIKVSPDKPYRCQAPAGSAGIQPRRSQTRWQSLDSLIECCVRLDIVPNSNAPPCIVGAPRPARDLWATTDGAGELFWRRKLQLFLRKYGGVVLDWMPPGKIVLTYR
jgi:hypothetical protein